MGMEGDYNWDMNNEKQSKSRAQEIRMRIDALDNDILAGQARVNALRSELKLICPHPDEYVKKLTDFRGSKINKRVALYVCKLCGQTKRKGDRTP